MEWHKQLLIIDTIREELIPVKKRHSISNSTIAKYVNELAIILEPLFGHQVILNFEKNGWIFDSAGKRLPKAKN
jgi:hypothetical protein